jgi:G3E family GTPase
MAEAAPAPAVTDQRTPVVLVTGFLGSGKTTLLNRALKSSLLAGAAVVINEFGAVPIDHLLSEASDDQIVVLENGCLCCTVFGDLIATLNRLYHEREAGRIPRFDRVIIETSGLADPRPIVQAFLSDPTLEGLYRLESVLAVLDAVNGPATLEQHDQSVHQLALADRILVSKQDLLGAHREQGVEVALLEHIRRINPVAQVHSTGDPALDPVRLLLQSGYSLRRGAGDVLGWLGAHAYLNEGGGPAHKRDHDNGHEQVGPTRHGGPQISSFCFVRQEPVSRYGLELLLGAVEQNLGTALLRLKGLINVQEHPDTPAVIQGAQHLLHNLAWLEAWPSADRSTRIVFITSGIERADLEEMVGLLDRVAQRTAKARERVKSAG